MEFFLQTLKRWVLYKMEQWSTSCQLVSPVVCRRYQPPQRVPEGLQPEIPTWFHIQGGATQSRWTPAQRGAAVSNFTFAETREKVARCRGKTKAGQARAATGQRDRDSPQSVSRFLFNLDRGGRRKTRA